MIPARAARAIEPTAVVTGSGSRIGQPGIDARLHRPDDFGGSEPDRSTGLTESLDNLVQLEQTGTDELAESG